MNPLLKSLIKTVGPGSELGLVFPISTGGFADVVITNNAPTPSPADRRRVVAFATAPRIFDRYVTTEQDSGQIVGTVKSAAGKG